MTDVSTPTVSSLTLSFDLELDENNNIHAGLPDFHNSPTSLSSHRAHIQTSEENRILLDASTSEDKIKLLRKELLHSLKENKTLISSQELLFKENDRLRREVANLHQCYAESTEKSKYFTKSTVLRSHHENIVKDLSNEIHETKNINTQLRSQNDDIANDFNKLKKQHELKLAEIEQSDSERKILEIKLSKISKSNDKLVEKTKKALEQAENRENQHVEEIQRIQERYNSGKEGEGYLQGMCRRLSENAANDRAEIERLREEKYKKSENYGNNTQKCLESEKPQVNELLYMPALTNTQKDMILDVQAAQKRGLLRMKHLNIENRSLKSELGRAKKTNRHYQPSACVRSLQQEDGIRVWELLENEKLQTQRVLSELAQVEQELDTFRVERAVDKLELYETRNKNVVLAGKVQAIENPISGAGIGAGMDNQISDITDNFVKGLTQKVCSLERQCESLREKELILNRKRKILAKTAKPKFTALRLAIKKQKMVIDDRESEISRQKVQIDAFRHLEQTLKGKISLYQLKMERCQGEMEVGDRKLLELKGLLEGKQTTIEHLQTLTKQIAEDINFGSIKTTVDNMVRDIKDLKDTKSVASMRSNNRRKSNIVSLKSVSSSTEDLRSDTTEDLSSTLSCSTSATPSALSRAAENVVNAELNQSEIGPIVKRSRKSLMPRRNSYVTQSHAEFRVLKRRITSLTNALSIAKTSHSHLETQLESLTKEYYNEKSRADNFSLRERTCQVSLKNCLEKCERLHSELVSTKEILDTKSAELDSRWSRKEQEIRESRLKMALENLKRTKQDMLEAVGLRTDLQSEVDKLKDQVKSQSAQIGRQRVLVEESKSKYVGEKSRIEEVLSANADFAKKLEQAELDLGHKKLHIGNLKRQVGLQKEKIKELDEQNLEIKQELVAECGKQAGLHKQVLENKRKRILIEKQAEEGVLNLQKVHEEGMELLRINCKKAEANAKEFCLCLVSVADCLMIKTAKTRNSKASRYEHIAEEKREILKTEHRNQAETSKTMNSRAEQLAMSILDISNDDLSDIMTGGNVVETDEIRALLIKARELRNGLRGDIDWQNGFIADAKSKMSFESHSFSQVLCKSLVEKIEELCELCS